MDPEIVGYIREHRDTYTREAITRHLLDAGHTQEAIDAAWWQTVDPDPEPGQAPAAAEGAAPQEPPILRQPDFWLALAGYIVGTLLLTNLFNVINIFLGLIFYAGALLVGFFYPIVRFDRNRAVAVGMLCGLAAIVVLLFVKPGLCTVAFGDLGEL